MLPIKSTLPKICSFKQKMLACTMSMSYGFCSFLFLIKKTFLGILVFIRNDLTRIYSNLNRLNEDMASSYRIRQQNFVEMQKNLDAVNSVLKSSIRLRGKIQAIQLSSLWLKIYDFSLVFVCSGKICGKNDATFQDSRKK